MVLLIRGGRSRKEGGTCTRTEGREQVKKQVLMSCDAEGQLHETLSSLTHHHNSEMESFTNRLAVMLVWQIGDCWLHACIQAWIRNGCQTPSNDTSLHPTYPASFFDIFARG
jgi:hypothetical protein